MSSYHQRLQTEKRRAISLTDLAGFRERLRNQARRWMCPSVRSHVDSSDLIQETLLLSISRYSQLLGRPKREIYRWMVSVMRYRLMHYAALIRREKLEGGPSHTHPKAPQSDIVDELLSQELRQMVVLELERLNPLWRNIFHLHYVEGLKFSEIAMLVGKTESAVRSAHHRMLKEMKPRIQRQVK